MATDTYAGPEWARWLDSMEGVPEFPSPAARKAPANWQKRVAKSFERLGELAPGMALALGLAVAGERLASWFGTAVLGFSHSPISAVPVAVLLGLLVRNAIGLPAVYEPGLKVCVRFLLRVGIVLLGLRLSLAAVSVVGLVSLPIIAICIGTALVAVAKLGRAVGLPRRLSGLIAVGTSICGVSAIVAAAAAIDAKDDEVSYAVACVTLFGLLALFTYPFFAYWACGGDAQVAGIFLGTAIHDTAQVAGAGLIYQQQYDAPEALNNAAVTKLVRNTCMAAVIPLMAIAYLRNAQERKAGRMSWHQAVPLFVPLFVLAATVRTVGDLGEKPFGVLTTETWREWLTAADKLSGWFLALAMVAVGLGTGLGKLRNLGLKPFGVGLAAALIVGGVSLGLLTVARTLGWVGGASP
jgi:uncharacterized integral membrane protein (TIGR00698 family)